MKFIYFDIVPKFVIELIYLLAILRLFQANQVELEKQH